MYDAAAREIQRTCGRGARIRSVYRRRRAAVVLQSRFRGGSCRAALGRHLHKVDECAACRIIALYRGWKGRAIARRARVEEAESAASELQRMYRGRVGKRLFDLARMSKLEANARDAQRAWRGRRARREIVGIREEMSKIRESLFMAERGIETCVGIADKFWQRSRRLHAAHVAIVALRDYDAAVEILDQKDEPAFLYASAIALQLAWSRTTKYKSWTPRLLDRAMALAKRARRLDPEGTSYGYWLHTYFSQGKCDAAGLCARAVALHTVRSDPCMPTNQNKKRKIFSRCRNLYARAKEKDPCRKSPEIEACSSVFEALYATPTKRLGHRRVDVDGVCFVIQVSRAGRKLVCSACDRDNHDTLLEDYVVHESEIATDIVEALLDDSRSEQSAAADYVLSRVTVVAPPKYALSLPELDRIRDRRVESKREQASARLLVKAYRRFDSRSCLKRLVFRSRQRDIQAAKLAYRRAIAHLNRIEMRQIVSRIQAKARGARVRRYSLVLMSAVRLIQYRMRATLRKNARVAAGDTPEDYDSRQARVDVVCRRGHNLRSSTASEDRTTTKPHLVTVSRCGDNFKFVAEDLENCAEYVGYCYKDEVGALLLGKYGRATCRDDERKTVDLLLENLTLITPLAGIPTADLNGRKKVNFSTRQANNRVLVVEDPRRRLEGVGTQETRGLDGRQLRDTKHVLRRHNAKVEACRKEMRARGYY